MVAALAAAVGRVPVVVPFGIAACAAVFVFVAVAACAAAVVFDSAAACAAAVVFDSAAACAAAVGSDSVAACAAVVVFVSAAACAAVVVSVSAAACAAVVVFVSAAACAAVVVFVSAAACAVVMHLSLPLCRLPQPLLTGTLLRGRQWLCLLLSSCAVTEGWSRRSSSVLQQSCWQWPGRHNVVAASGTEAAQVATSQ